MTITLWFAEIPESVMDVDEFRCTYGSLIEDINMKGGYACKCYYPFYMLRRMIYAIILVVLEDYPTLQIGLITVVLNIPVRIICLYSTNIIQ